MFTGIITHLGEIIEINNKREDWIVTLAIPFHLKLGQSLACNGICLTITHIAENKLISDYNSEEKFHASVCISQATREVTTASLWKLGKKLNLERSLAIGSRLDGHFVFGHVDCVAKVIELTKIGESYRLRLMICSDNSNSLLSKEKDKEPAEIFHCIVPKGSITLNGIAFTVNHVDPFQKIIEVNVIPYTYENTNLRYNKNGDYMNIELDILGKYISNIIKNHL